MKFLEIQIPERVRKEILAGNLSSSIKMLRSELINSDNLLYADRIKYEIERIIRLKKTYPFSFKTAFKKASSYIKNLSLSEFKKLVKKNICDWIFINGKMKFEERFFYNIVFTEPKYKVRAVENPFKKKAKEFLDMRIKNIIKGSKPCDYKVCIKFSLIPNVNERVRVWLPVAKEGFQISNVNIIKTSPEFRYITSSSHSQRTIYFEGEGGKSYSVVFEFRIGEWTKERFRFFEKRENLKKYLRESYPHIKFSYHLVELVKKIIGKEKNNFKRASKVYDWIVENIKYSFVKPYIFYDNITEWVYSNRKGDCGFQALFFITLLRICGVPARWQSGWYINPYYQSPHDWALFYSDEYGWLPCDLSFGGSRKDDESLRKFYFGNLDGFRVVFNDEFMGDIYPIKKFFRSDPYDNQVGEVETKYRNVFDFKYRLELLKFEEVL
ncbi:MAG: transglutaminase-like domain-containing protein [Elusimicrobiales bacterium]|nr:transglutaminase-like domain-containing protein [Elusimicrobiales bacterium]